MPYLQLFEPALCCASGVCGPDADDTLVRVSADVAWLKTQSVSIDRYNLAQTPMAFVQTAQVRAWIESKGTVGLPVLLVDGELAMAFRYPTRAELARFAGLANVPAGPSSCAAGSGCC
jgi:hypothetical protein